MLENNIRNLAQIQYAQEAFVCLLYVQKMAFFSTCFSARVV